MIIIPDVHGRDFWKKPVYENIANEHVVFLGDFLDPYPPSIYDLNDSTEPITSESCIENFRAIIQLKKDVPDRVTLLLGNHDCEYLYGTNVCDCRCDHKNYELIQNLFRENKGLFQMATESYRGGKHFVFSHAGICVGWMDRHVKGWTVENMVEQLNQLNTQALRAEFPEETAFAKALSERDQWRGGNAVRACTAKCTPLRSGCRGLIRKASIKYTR